MPVRSAALFTLHRTGSAAAQGPTVRFTCGSGQTVIVKSLVVSSFSAAAPVVIIYGGPDALRPIIYLNLALPVTAVLHIPVWLVLEPGDTLVTFIDLVNASDQVWISAHGAILEGVA